MAPNDGDISGLREDIRALHGKVDAVQKTVNETKTETAVIKERLDTHLAAYNSQVSIWPWAQRAVILLFVGAVGSLLVIGITHWIKTL